MGWTESLRSRFINLRKKFPYRRAVRFIQRYPFRAFFITLGILLLLIIVSNISSLFGPKTLTPQTPAKEVNVYRIGTSPKVTLQAKIEKSGVIKMVSQTSGIVQEIDANEGDNVYQGRQIMSFSSNYQGGNASGLQAAIADKQNEITQSTYQEQKDVIKKQRDLANDTQSNNDQLRDISSQSLNDTRDLINLDVDIINGINDNLSNLQNTNVNGSNDQLILQTKELKSQYEATLNQLSNQERTLNYQTDTTKSSVALQNDQKDITLKQLDIQEKTLDINKEISGLQDQLAAVNASLMFPSSPCSGVVDRIFVTYGQSVTPGTPIASISCDNQSVKAIVQVPSNLASTVSRVEPTTLHLDDQTFDEVPDYVSRDATDGSLYTVIYHLPDNMLHNSTDGMYITADIPIGLPNTSASDPYIPLDAIYQTQDEAYLFKVVKGKVQSEKIDLGNVYGRYVSVNNGVTSGDQIILNRDIVDGQKVTVSK